jgi:hypothetical protein
LNLFLALLLASFGSNVLREKEKDDDDNKIGEAIDRIQRCFRFIIRSIFRLFCRKKRRQVSTILESATTETIFYNRVCLNIIFLSFNLSHLFLKSLFL